MPNTTFPRGNQAQKSTRPAQGCGAVQAEGHLPRVACCLVWSLGHPLPGLALPSRASRLRMGPSRKGSCPLSYRAGQGSGKMSPFLSRKKPTNLRVRDCSIYRLGLVGAPWSAYLLDFALSGLQATADTWLSLAAALRLSASASPSLQHPTLPRPHWQSRFETCQLQTCSLYECGTRHVLAAPARRWPWAHSSLIPCSLSNVPWYSSAPWLCQVGLGAWGCPRLPHCPV